MKKWSATAVILMLLGLGTSAWAAEFNKGSLLVTPQVGLNSYAIPFGVSVEYGVTPNIGVGATAMFMLWSDEFWTNTVIGLSADAAYHFTQLDVEKLDLFAGASLGFTIYSWSWKSGYDDWLDGSTGASGLYLSPFIAGRYYFSPKIAACLKAYFSIVGSWSGVGGILGVTIRLK
jgi:hypothetical protein